MLQFSITNGSMRHPYRVQVLDTDLSPDYRARRDQRVAMLVLRIAVRVGAVSYPPPEWGTDRTTLLAGLSSRWP
jgi:hypothetical protein